MESIVVILLFLAVIVGVIWIEMNNVEREFPGNMARGSRGEDVADVQRLLKVRGAKVLVDGIFGENTESAVKAFQKSKKLKVDGIVGPLTWAALNK